MKFWDFNIFCYICQRVFDPQCKSLFLQSNISLGFIVPNNLSFDLDNCYFENFNLLEENVLVNNVNQTIIKYNFEEDIEEMVDYIENEIAFEESFSFYLYFNNNTKTKSILNFNYFDYIDSNSKKKTKKDNNFILNNKKSLFKLLPNLFGTTRNISSIYFDLYIDEDNGFFDKDGNPKLSYFWLNEFLL